MNQINGILNEFDKKITFYEQDYRFVFMNTSDDFVTVKPEGHFIYGTTFKNEKIAINSSISVPVNNTMTLKTNSYIISKPTSYVYDIKKFKSISFKNGTLKSLFLCNALNDVDYSKLGELHYKYVDDSIKYNVSLSNFDLEFIVHSDINESIGVAGRVLNNRDVILTLNFSVEQSIEDVYKYISKIDQLVSILTFRKNIDYDEILIHHNDYVYSCVKIEQLNQLTEKEYHRCINFDRLGDSTRNLLELLFSDSKSSVIFDAGFIPESDKKANVINNDIIRSISSALECEMGYINSEFKENEELEKLKKAVSDLVKEHRKNNNVLNSKTYDSIFLNVKHWSVTESERIFKVYEKYKNVLYNVLSSDDEVCRERIKNLLNIEIQLLMGDKALYNKRLPIQHMQWNV